ncbi:putative transcription factor bHLH041 [Miscanthus floridulus]|uniref:putative transcription factor bHLH041 n=1 Tax=Miscanthus floridulus TaxID=154761 RepID=UPI0034581F24
MELPAHDLSSSTSLPVQQQFYQEAGIKMAAFMGCESGEIEIGMSTAASSGGSPRSLESTLQQFFSEDFFQQSLLEELLQLPPTRPSSPSSSLPSVSVGSPAADVSTSLQRTVAVTPAPSSVERQAAPPVAPPPPRPPLPFVRHGGPGHVCFPSAEADDAAMAQAMLDVISASSSSALPTPPSTATAPPPPPPGNHHRARRRGAATSFRAYNAALAPRAPWRPPGAPGQRMIKMGISILRRMHMLRFSRERSAGGTTTMPQRGQEGEDDPSSSAVPSSSQLNHMISERRRRERLNESFEALRGLLPPGSKKDKATVLAKTLDYMNILVAQIADLEAKNRSLESRAHHHHRHANGGSSSLEQRVVVLQGLMSGTPSSSERVQVHVTGAGGDVSGMSTSSSSSAGLPPPGREAVTVRVHARAAQGDVAELVARALAVIKDMGCFAVVDVNAGRPSDGGGDVAQATFTLRATAGEFDAASLREAVRKAAEDSATPPSDDS